MCKMHCFSENWEREFARAIFSDVVNSTGNIVERTSEMNLDQNRFTPFNQLQGSLARHRNTTGEFLLNLTANNEPWVLVADPPVDQKVAFIKYGNYLPLTAMKADQYQKLKQTLTEDKIKTQVQPTKNIENSSTHITQPTSQPPKRVAAAPTPAPQPAPTQPKRKREYLTEEDLPLHIANTFSLLSLGKIFIHQRFFTTDWEESTNKTTVHVFPIGYTTRSLNPDYENPLKLASYINQIGVYNSKTNQYYMSLEKLQCRALLQDVASQIILNETNMSSRKSLTNLLISNKPEDSESYQPCFIVYKESSPDKKFFSKSPSGCWMQMRKVLARSRSTLGMPVESSVIIGPNKMRLTNPSIKEGIEHLEGFDELSLLYF